MSTMDIKQGGPYGDTAISQKCVRESVWEQRLPNLKPTICTHLPSQTPHPHLVSTLLFLLSTSACFLSCNPFTVKILSLSARKKTVFPFYDIVLILQTFLRPDWLSTLQRSQGKHIFTVQMKCQHLNTNYIKLHLGETVSFHSIALKVAIIMFLCYMLVCVIYWCKHASWFPWWGCNECNVPWEICYCISLIRMTNDWTHPPK